MKHGMGFMLAPFPVVRAISQFYQESGPAVSNLSTVGTFVWSPNDIGRPMPWWNGIELLRSDYLDLETVNTGLGSDARVKNTAGTMYSIFAILNGMPGSETDPGININFGGDTHQSGEFFRPERFEKLEDFDAAGLRLTSYITLTCGSTLGIARVVDLDGSIPTA